MKNKFLLYIDILGFSELVEQSPQKIDDLYEVIASLNAHDHEAFKCVIFSDTILVYNVNGGEYDRDIKYLIMYLCEFARDLLHRLTNRGILFRAVITNGYFRHYQLNEVPCFYGTALVKAYLAEKDIKAIGLFIDNALLKYSDIFHTQPFDDEFSFVFITQALNEIEPLCAPTSVPGVGSYLEQTDLTWMGGPELLHIAAVLNGLKAGYPDPVRLKYSNTVDIFRQRYPKIVSCLESNQLDITQIAPDADWAPVIQRHPQSCSYAIKSRTEF